MEINVVRCKEWSSPTTPTLRAFVVLEIVVPGLTLELRELKYHEPEGEDPFGREGWVITPSRPWENSAGETKHASLYRFTEEEQYYEFRDKSVAAIRRHLYPTQEPVVPDIEPEQVEEAPVYDDEIPF